MTKLFTTLAIAAAAAAAMPAYGADITPRVKDAGSDMPARAKSGITSPAPTAHEAAAGVELMGCAFGSSAGHKSGLYKFSTTAPEVMTLLNEDPQATGGGTYGKGKYYCQWYLSIMGSDVWTNFVYDTNTWEWKGEIGSRETWAYDLAYDDATDRIYGCFHDPDEQYEGARLVFGWIEADKYATPSPSIHPVCDVFEAYDGLAFDGTGQLFALTREGKLYRLDKETGATTLVGTTGLVGYYNTSATIDKSTGTMYYFLCLKDGPTSLYAIDTTTAEATHIYDLAGGEEVQGLAIFEPMADADAPAAAKNLTLDFEGGSLTGNVSFTTPTKTYGGADGGGMINYSVAYRLYDEEDSEYFTLTNGITTYGQDITVPVTLPDNYQYVIAVTLNNSAGNSPTAVVDRFIGYDTPLSPLECTLTSEGTQMTLTWTAVEKTMHNGYLDTDALTYYVTRIEGDVETVVAEATKATSLTETLTMPEQHTSIRYSVRADNHGMVSAAETSNAISLGTYTAPYVCDFETADQFGEFTVLCKESDPGNFYHWEYHAGYQAAHVGNGKYADDDWLITPAIRLEGGKKYTVKLTVANNNANSLARFTLNAGNEPTRDGMGQHELLALTEFTCKRPQTTEYQANFTPAADGLYYVGIHSLALASSWDDFIVYHIELKDSDNSGIADVTATEAAAEYYTIDGRRVSADAAHGLVIVKRGTQVRKVIIK